jgi:hypothetical protein
MSRASFTANRSANSVIAMLSIMIVSRRSYLLVYRTEVLIVSQFTSQPAPHTSAPSRSVHEYLVVGVDGRLLCDGTCIEAQPQRKELEKNWWRSAISDGNEVERRSCGNWGRVLGGEDVFEGLVAATATFTSTNRLATRHGFRASS